MKHTIKILGATGLLALASAAQADFYVGAGAYSSSIDVAGDTDRDLAPSVFLGWRPLEMVGVEAGYIDLGSYSLGGNDLEAHAMTLAGLLSMELGPVGIYAKAGLADSMVELNGTSDSSNDPFGGVGLSIDALDKLYVYAEYLRFSNDNVDVDAFGAGVRYSF